MQIISGWVLVGAVGAAMLGCVETRTKQCGAFVCSEVSVCAPDGASCVLPSQLDACAGHATGDSCSYPGTSAGACNGPVCLPAGCGNGVVEPASEETCDDGNRNSLDGCSADCRSDERCGDGVADLAVGETCDCGDGSTAVPGCAGPNSDAAGAQCRADCKLARCGDGVKDPLEQCDDGNTIAGDGCRADCAGRWTQMPTDTFAYLTAVWGAAPDDVFAVGAKKILHYDGATWTSQALPSAVPEQGYTAVWGTAGNNVYALGDKRLDHYDGTSWSSSYVLPFQGRAIWGSSQNDIWIGGSNDTDATFLAHWTGSAWLVDTAQPTAVIGLWGSGPNDVYALWDQDPSGNGASVYLFHYSSGGPWQPVTGTSSTMLADAFPATLIYGTSATDVLALEPYNTTIGGTAMHHRIGTSWTTAACCDEIQQGGNGLGGVAGDVLLVGDLGHILRNDGTTWAISRTPTTAKLLAVWGSSVSHAFVVGENGTILY